MTDLILACGHHLLVFALAGILAYELAIVRPGLGADRIVQLARVDLWYGILAALILALGFSRAIFAAKGWAYYASNAFFWAKLAIFLLIGLLSLLPTRAFLRWRRAAAVPTFAAPASEVASVTRVLWLEVALFALLPLCAAAMARGFGHIG